MLVPVSLLGSYEYCPRKVFLERVLKVVAPPRDVMVKGSIMHRAFELLSAVDAPLAISMLPEEEFDAVLSRYNAEYSKVLRSAVLHFEQELLSLNLSSDALFSDALPGFLNEAKSRASLVFRFAREHDTFGSELWGALVPKIRYELSLSSDKLLLTGRVDQLQVFEKDYLPVELKSGKLPARVWHSHELQLAGYALLLEEKFSVPVNKGIVRYIDHDISREVLINPFLRHEVRILAKEVFELLNSQELPKKLINSARCTACSLKTGCPGAEKLLLKSNKNNKV